MYEMEAARNCILFSIGKKTLWVAQIGIPSDLGACTARKFRSFFYTHSHVIILAILTVLLWNTPGSAYIFKNSISAKPIEIFLIKFHKTIKIRSLYHTFVSIVCTSINIISR